MPAAFQYGQLASAARGREGRSSGIAASAAQWQAGDPRWAASAINPVASASFRAAALKTAADQATAGTAATASVLNTATTAAAALGRTGMEVEGQALRQAMVERGATQRQQMVLEHEKDMYDKRTSGRKRMAGVALLGQGLGALPGLFTKQKEIPLPEYVEADVPTSTSSRGVAPGPVRSAFDAPDTGSGRQLNEVENYSAVFSGEAEKGVPVGFGDVSQLDDERYRLANAPQYSRFFR